MVEHQTGMPLTVSIPSVAEDFSPGVNFQCRLSYGVCTSPQLQALTSVRTLKIPLSMSEFEGLKKH